MSTRPRGRYRAEVRPKTPLSTLSEAVSANAATMGRRSAVLAASSGLVVTMGLPAAGATTGTDPAGRPDAGTTEAVAAVPEQAGEKAAPAAAPAAQVVAAADDAELRIKLPHVSTAEAPPPPPPEPEPAVRDEQRGQTASRSTTRESTASSSSGSSEGSASAAAPVTSASGSNSAILAIAARYVGTPYSYGGASPSGFDCSGYTQYVYGQAGISLPRTSGGQGSGGRRISASEARPGDLVWSGSGHIGIYAGGGMMYDAPRSGKTVQKRSIWFNPIFVTYTH